MKGTNKFFSEDIQTFYDLIKVDDLKRDDLSVEALQQLHSIDNFLACALDAIKDLQGLGDEHEAP